MRAQGLVSLVGILVITIGLLIGSLVAGNEPLLGLDLQGGVEVVLEPVDEAGDVTAEDLDVAVSIIRDRVDDLGVAEPDITRQGDRVVVQIPGIEDQERALELVGQTAELRFRPVLLGPLPAEPVDPETLIDEEAEAEPEEEATEEPEATEEATEEPEATEDATEEPEATEDATEEPEATEEATEEPEATEEEDDAALGDEGTDGADLGIDELLSMETTTREDDDPNSNVLLEQSDPDGNAVSRWYLGPTAVTGAALEGAGASLQGFEWVVTPTFRSGEDGIDAFNAIASECFAQTEVCPTGQLAIVLDGEVVSAPAIQQPVFTRDQIVISGGPFTQGEAQDIALVLRYGALPIEFQDPAEAGFVRVVSATIGEDSLRAGVIAGIIGMSLVAAYMIAYYRLLGLVAILSLGVSATLLWVIIAFLGETQGLALTLAGVTGLIVSIGVSLDSNVVYFEHLKEDIRSGRTLRSSIDRAFPIAYRTIFWANFASLLAAAILYWLSIGSVRGFALMLGLASILDLIATYFFMRPLVRLIARSDAVVDRPGYFGMPETPELEAATA